MLKAIIIISIFLGYLLTISAQGVKIGNNANVADASAMLDVESTNKGVLHPRMTESQRDAIGSPATGLLIFQIDGTTGFYYYSGTAWTPVTSSGGFSTTVVPVTNPTTGETWMDRNLGASQVATSSTDAAAYGDLYQWGRGTDGHERRASAVISTLSVSDNPGHGAFIIASGSPYDWRSGQNAGLWQGVNGTNNPCPGGYRLPTDTELDAERLSWASNNAAGALASPLKLPMAGLRSSSSGSLLDVGTYGYYWSSTVSSADTRYLFFYSTYADMYTINRAYGLPVRCLKD